MGLAEDLWNECKTGVDWQILTEVSNPRRSEKTAPDHVSGVRACARVIQTYWPMYAQQRYDGTNPDHVELAIDVVLSYLRKRGGSPAPGVEEWDTVIQLMRDFARTTSRRHKPPRSTGVKVPTRERAGEQHDTARGRMDDYVPHKGSRGVSGID